MIVKRLRQTNRYHYGVLVLPLLVLILLVLCWNDSKRKNENTIKALHPRAELRRDQKRLAILLPYLGTAPAFLDVFCFGAGGASDIADFLVIGSLSGHPGCPSNVLFHEVSPRRLATLLSRTVEKDNLAMDRERFLTILEHNIEVYPYALVEFKPAYGHIFSEYIRGYSHWGYADLDILFGDLSRWITPDELNVYDIVTYGFGDQTHLYLRGQFTIHRNDAKITSLWKDCSYLSDLDIRYQNVMDKSEEYKFESAEGCYSAAVLKRNDISVKYAVKAWTDVEQNDPVYSHGLYISRHDGRHVIFKSSEHHAEHLESSWFHKDSVYRDRDVQLQVPVGEMEKFDLPNNPKAKCMYWVQKKYQRHLCITEDIGPDFTVSWIQGALYKQKHKNLVLPSDVETAPFFHFQEWKRYFRPSQVSCLRYQSQISSFLLTKEGAIPLYQKGLVEGIERKGLGVAPFDQRNWYMFHSKGIRRDLPSTRYCLVSGPRKSPSQPKVSECLENIAWQDTENIRPILSAPGWKMVSADSVTLVLTLQLTVDQLKSRKKLGQGLDILFQNLNRWGGPCVVVVAVPADSRDVQDILLQRYSSRSDSENVLMISVTHRHATVSRKSLLNLAIDVVPTRWFLHGIELERGLVISKEAESLAYLKVEAFSEVQGTVFILPQFGVREQDLEFDLQHLIQLQDSGLIDPLVEYEDLCEDGSIHAPPNVIDTWWATTKSLISSTVSDGTLFEEAINLEQLVRDFSELLSNEKLDDLFNYDESPILLTDNLGPRPGMRTSEVVRYIEELGGTRCFNPLYLSQLLLSGYNFQILDGAFAMSNESTRAAMIGTSDRTPSPCSGCFMFPGEHEDIADAIVDDERYRVAKASIIWNDLTIPSVL